MIVRKHASEGRIEGSGVVTGVRVTWPAKFVVWDIGPGVISKKPDVMAPPVNPT